MSTRFKRLGFVVLITLTASCKLADVNFHDRRNKIAFSSLSNYLVAWPRVRRSFLTINVHSWPWKKLLVPPSWGVYPIWARGNHSSMKLARKDQKNDTQNCTECFTKNWENDDVTLLNYGSKFQITFFRVFFFWFL